jgi:hypothetical protein
MKTMGCGLPNTDSMEPVCIWVVGKATKKCGV